MCSYNKVNGTYACENDYLLNRVLKRDIGFKGQVQSDWGATHSTVPAALAGLDEEEFLSRFFSQPLKDAVLAGEVPMSRLDDMVARKLRGLIAVGVYDDPPDGPGSIDVAAGARVAERLARRSMVLLKNRRRTLPLKRSLDSIGWTRVRLRPGQRRRVSVRIDPERLAIWDADRDRWHVPAGRYRVYVGASSRDIRLRDRVGVGAGR